MQKAQEIISQLGEKYVCHKNNFVKRCSPIASSIKLGSKEYKNEVNEEGKVIWIPIE